MSNRRTFLKSTAIVLPFISSNNSEAQLINGTPSFVPEFPPENDPQFWKKVRDMFPMRKDETYFNNGTLGAQPNVVLESVINDMRTNAVNIAQCDWRGSGPNLISGYNPYTGLREKAAKLINADVNEIALTQNATMGMNFIANGLELKAEDEIILTDLEHPGGRKGWDMMEKRKHVRINEVKLPVPANDPEEIIDIFKHAITSKTRVIAFDHIISEYGVIIPVKEICEEARKRGILSVVDGAQALGHIPVDVKDIDCDVYFSSPHKWLLAPAGNGILYIKQDIIKDVWTTLASINWDNHNDEGYRLTQRGTGNPSLLVGLEAAIDFHTTLGPKKVTDRIKYLGDYLRAGLKKINNVQINSSTNPVMCSGTTTYTINGMKSVEILDELWNRRKLRPRALDDDVGIRHTTHIYNSVEELDAALEIISDIAQNS